ncbi:DNA repair protein XRCC4 [Aplochiton taeniatus]
MRVTLQKVHIPSDSEHTYFLRVDWKGQDLGSGFQLLLTDGQDAWRGEVDEAAVCAEAEELEMQTERYIQDLQQALTHNGESSRQYSFSLTPPQPCPGAPLALAYEKVQGDISFRLGSVELSAVPDPLGAIRELLSHSLERASTVERRNHTLQLENQRLKQEQEHITAEMERYAVGKETLEAELYSRFVLVLNEKKSKIRCLQETVTRLEEDSTQRKEAMPDCTEPSQEEEEDDYGGSTDEEPLAPPTTTTAPSQESNSPSLLDDSLSDITDVAPCRKRRVRHLRPPDPVAKRPTPVTRRRRDSPVVVAAAARKELNPRRSTDARTTSPDVEDLFEDF